LQLATMARTLGPLPALFALPGIAVALARAAGWITMAFPLTYLLFMTGTRVSEHRNFVGLYPFAAVAFGCGVVALADRLAPLRLRPARRRVIRPALLVVPVAPCAVGIVASPAVSARLARSRETRALAIDAINETAAGARADPPRVGLAAELRFHAMDR